MFSTSPELCNTKEVLFFKKEDLSQGLVCKREFCLQMCAAKTGDAKNRGDESARDLHVTFRGAGKLRLSSKCQLQPSRWQPEQDRAAARSLWAAGQV